MSRSVFNKDKKLDQMKQPMFFGEDLQVQQRTLVVSSGLIFYLC